MSDPLAFPPEDVEGSLPGRFARAAASRASALAIVYRSGRLTCEARLQRAETMHRAFRRGVRVSPRQYRRHFRAAS